MAHWDKEQLFKDLDSLFVAMAASLEGDPRAAAVEAQLATLRATPLRNFQKGDAIAVTALVLLAKRLEPGRYLNARYLLAPHGDGRSLPTRSGPVTVVTPASALGQMLLGKRVDDVVTLQTAEGPLAFGVVSIV